MNRLHVLVMASMVMAMAVFAARNGVDPVALLVTLGLAARIAWSYLTLWRTMSERSRRSVPVRIPVRPVTPQPRMPAAAPARGPITLRGLSLAGGRAVPVLDPLNAP